MIALSKFPTSIRPKYPKAPLEVSEDTRLTPVSDDISVPDLEVESDTEPSDDDRFHQKILPIITILRCFGFISFTLPVEHRFWHKAKLYLLHSFYLFIAFSFLLLNVLIFTFNMYIVKISTYTFLNNRYAVGRASAFIFRESAGLLHVHTMTNVVTGLKPFQNIVNLLVFVANRNTHLKLLTVMGQLDPKLILIVVSIVSFSIPALIRAGQYVIMGSQLGEHLLDDVSLVLVPILSVWQLLPLFYFIIVSDMLRKWFKDVAMVLKR
uniref:Uncharacterized protein n=1 Tax=Plectus sambesii TaxID=2011161 RepID=A0A914XG48_9BILA